MGKIDPVSWLSPALGFAGGVVNNIVNRSNMKKQVEYSKELMDYQWNKYNSPVAQVSAYKQAGINPAVAFGESGPGQISGPSSSMPSTVPASFDLAGFSQANLAFAESKKALADAKKVGVDTRLSEVETDAKQFELDLNKCFQSAERVVSLSLAWKNAVLADDEHALKEWQTAKEKALAGLSGVQRDIAQRTLDNMDTQIKQENMQREESIKLTQEQQKTERSSQVANRAAANASNAQADLHRSNKKYQDIVNDIKDSGKVFELENLIQKWRSENKINSYQYENAKFWLRRMSRLNKQLSGNDLKSKIERELDDFFWYWKDEVPNIDMPTFMIPLK